MSSDKFTRSGPICRQPAREDIDHEHRVEAFLKSAEEHICTKTMVPSLKTKRSKSEIRVWLKTEEGKAWLAGKIHEKDAEKSVQRKAQALKEVARLGLHHDCSKCLHEIGHHCSWHLPNGCQDFLEVGVG